MKKALLTIEIEYDETKTDAESVASALDNLLETGSSTLDGPMEEYGDPSWDEFFVAVDDGEPTPHGKKVASDVAGKAFDEAPKKGTDHLR